QSLADRLELPLTRDIGYPTPGSLGTYCMENNIDCMTLELDDNLSNEETWQRYGIKLAKAIDKMVSG
ncbi:MAG: murein tripeptide amidase MpaA, partial [Cyanobacteria bacterium]|nr:murein tripeptide amidase MpaA [Cyanobacteriota bacterium]